MHKQPSKSTSLVDGTNSSLSPVAHLTGSPPAVCSEILEVGEEPITLVVEVLDLSSEKHVMAKLLGQVDSDFGHLFRDQSK